MRQPAVYIMANGKNGTLYTGVTSCLATRIWQHKQAATKSFTAQYNCKLLVYYEFYEDMYAAISREKQIKAGSRHKKCTLIADFNPNWRDLYEDLM